jgi:hypothetical protein
MMRKAAPERFLPTADPVQQLAARSLVRGFRDGLGAAAVVLFEPSRTLRRECAGRGVAGDWTVVGRTLRRAAGFAD